jgi:hypothetical protein
MHETPHQRNNRENRGKRCSLRVRAEAISGEGPAGLGTKNHCAGEGQQQFSRQAGGLSLSVASVGRVCRQRDQSKSVVRRSPLMKVEKALLS